MAREEKLITLSDIECKEIVEKIKECTNIVEKFRCVLNNHLEYKNLVEPQIFIVRSPGIAFEDDGNTNASGYRYKIYWCFPYIEVDKNVTISDIILYESYMWPKCLLFFSLDISERIRDHKCTRYHYFELHLTEEERTQNSEYKIAGYNDNYKLSCMLEVENIYLCIEKINEVYNRLLVKQTLLEELTEYIYIPNVEEYINKNCKIAK